MEREIAAGMINPVRCPFCVEANERSRVGYEDATATTLLPVEQFFDEDGRRHVHDPNWRTTAYSCSRGHNWTEARRGGCQACGEEPEVEIRQR